MAQHRPFTVDQANSMIPWLESVFDRLDEHRGSWDRHQQRTQILETMWGEDVASPDNPDHGELLDHRRGMEQAAREVEAVVDRDILGRGLRFPAGGLENGIVDFPTTYEGRWVYLCWRRGETLIGHWHELDTGFRGRQDVTAEHAVAMGHGDDIPDDSALDF
jgi:hypothetical protein